MIHSEDNDSKYVRADFPWFDVLEMQHYTDAQDLMVHGGRTKLILRKAVQQWIVTFLKYQFCIDRNSGKITFTPRLALPGEFNQRLVQGSFRNCDICISDSYFGQMEYYIWVFAGWSLQTAGVSIWILLLWGWSPEGIIRFEFECI